MSGDGIVIEAPPEPEIKVEEPKLEETPMRPGRRRRTPMCQRCSAELTAEKPYYQRYKICPQCASEDAVDIDGVPSRFCQQCGRFQPTDLFEGTNRTCRERLDRHALRRRRNNAIAKTLRDNARVSGRYVYDKDHNYSPYHDYEYSPYQHSGYYPQHHHLPPPEPRPSRHAPPPAPPSPPQPNYMQSQPYEQQQQYTDSAWSSADVPPPPYAERPLAVRFTSGPSLQSSWTGPSLIDPSRARAAIEAILAATRPSPYQEFDMAPAQPPVGGGVDAAAAPALPPHFDGEPAPLVLKTAPVGEPRQEAAEPPQQPQEEEVNVNGGAISNTDPHCGNFVGGQPPPEIEVATAAVRDVAGQLTAFIENQVNLPDGNITVNGQTLDITTPEVASQLLDQLHTLQAQVTEAAVVASSVAANAGLPVAALVPSLPPSTIDTAALGGSGGSNNTTESGSIMMHNPQHLSGTSAPMQSTPATWQEQQQHMLPQSFSEHPPSQQPHDLMTLLNVLASGGDNASNILAMLQQQSTAAAAGGGGGGGGGGGHH